MRTVPFRISAPRRLIAAIALALSLAPSAGAQEADSTAARPDTARTAAADRPWYEDLSLRGYIQLRYNQLLRTNPELTCAQCDRSIGRNGGLFLRRVRLIVSGDVTERVSVYVQPDFANEVDGTLGVLQIRDAYADVALNADKSLRVRLGQSKIPYGWENMQSSGNRIAFDRSDPINSALVNEREISVIGYWAPAPIRARLRELVDRGLKGSGDYGALGVGVFNGQGANRAEANDGLHTVARASWPFRLRGGQFVEVGVQGYAGRVVLPAALRSPGLVAGTPTEFTDRRVAGTFVLYPQPFGLQVEYNVGRGPEADPAARTVRERGLDGGYVLASWRLRPRGQILIPYVQAQRYDGGKKFELDARRYRVREAQVGAEWSPTPGFELTAAYQFSDRTYEDLATPVNRQRGRLLRLQAQLNY